MIAVALSTLATNIAANIVSPANDFANLAPARIDFKKGGYLTGLIGLLIFPWKLIADPNGYIFTWLIAYSSLLGPIGGILIADYYVIRKKQLQLTALYQPNGEYRYRNGWNLKALAALVVGILPNVPGFFTQIALIPRDAMWPWVPAIYNYAWFVGFILSGVTYYLLMKKQAVAANDLSTLKKGAYRVSTH
jgi:NCS1 family nucleobase:cation symporter-1